MARWWEGWFWKFEGWSSQADFAVTSRYFGTLFFGDLTEQTGLPNLKVFQTELLLQGYARLLSKSLTILQTLGCDSCTWYTLTRLGVMMGISGFITLYPSPSIILLVWSGIIGFLKKTKINSNRFKK